MGTTTPKAAKAPTVQLTWSPVTKWGWTHGLRRREMLRKTTKKKREVKELAAGLLRVSLSNPMAADSPQHFSPLAGDSADISRSPVTDRWSQTWGLAPCISLQCSMAGLPLQPKPPPGATAASPVKLAQPFWKMKCEWKWAPLTLTQQLKSAALGWADYNSTPRVSETL